MLGRSSFSWRVSLKARSNFRIFLCPQNQTRWSSAVNLELLNLRSKEEKIRMTLQIVRVKRLIFWAFFLF